MDLKTRLEDDQVIFAKYSHRGTYQKHLEVLNSRGIYTVEDFVNYKKCDFPSTSKELYIAYIDILRHEYLGQELVLDALLEEEYKFKYIEQGNSRGYYENAYKCAEHLYRLGFRPRPTSKVNNIYYLSRLLERFLNDNEYKGEPLSMEYLLKEWVVPTVPGPPDLRIYYLEYIDKKRKKYNVELTPETMPSILEGLKMQLQGLLTMRDGIDKRIEEVQEQLKLFEEGEKSHGRK